MLYIDISALKNPYTGVGKTVDYLVKALRKAGIVFKEIAPPKYSGIRLLFYYNFLIPKNCNRNLSNDDIFLIPNNLGKYFRLPHHRTWVLIHDVIPLSRFGYKGIKRLLYRLKIYEIKKAERILTISETVKKQLIDLLDISPEKITVIYWPLPSNSDIINQTISYNFKHPYFLSIGTGEPRKYVEPLIEQWVNIAPTGFSLLLYGGEWRKGAHSKLKSLIQRTHQEDRISILGRINEVELYQLYKNASGFIFPSLEEGFGLPPLEALSVGTPIILPKTPINYELYSEIANFYSIDNISELRIAIKSAIEPEPNHEKIKSFCSKYSIEKFENKLKEIFHEEKSTN